MIKRKKRNKWGKKWYIKTSRQRIEMDSTFAGNKDVIPIITGYLLYHTNVIINKSLALIHM